MTRNAGKAFFAFSSYLSGAHQQPNVEYDNKAASQQPKLFDDDSKNKIGKCLRKEISLDTVARHFTNDIAGGNGDIGMGNLAFLSISYLAAGTASLSSKNPFNTILPRLYTMHHRYITILLCRCYHNHPYKYDGNDSYDKKSA